MNDVHTKPAGWKQKLVHEMVEYWLNFVYLAFFLVAFTWYRRLTLAEYHVHFTGSLGPPDRGGGPGQGDHGGRSFGLGSRAGNKPLILLTFYRTVAFSVWVGVFSVLEETVRGLLARERPAGRLRGHREQGPV